MNHKNQPLRKWKIEIAKNQPLIKMGYRWGLTVIEEAEILISLYHDTAMEESAKLTNIEIANKLSN